LLSPDTPFDAVMLRGSEMGYREELYTA